MNFNNEDYKKAINKIINDQKEKIICCSCCNFQTSITGPTGPQGPTCRLYKSSN